MNKDFLPDWLPAVLVRDVRQALRSPWVWIAVLAMLVLVGVNYGMLTEVAAGVSRKGQELAQGLVTMGWLVACVVVPLRVGLQVAAETRVPALNFIRLSRLGSWQVVWGAWLSGALQVLVLAGLLFGMHLGLRPAGELLPAEYLPFVLLVSQGVLLVAVCQTGCQLSGVVRALGMLILLFALGAENAWLGAELRHFPDAATCAPQLVLLLLAHGVMTLVALAEARRPYAHPAEDCSWAGRWLSLAALPVAGVVLLPGYGLQELGGAAGGWACAVLLGVGVWGLLYPVPSHDGVPGLASRRDLWVAALWLTGMTVVCALVMLQMSELPGALPPEPAGGEGAGMVLPAVWLVHGYFWVGLLVCLLSLALVCQVARRHAPLLFVLGGVGMLTLCMVQNVGIVLTGNSVSWWGLLPLLPPLDGSLLHLYRTVVDAWQLAVLLGVKLLWLVVLLVCFFVLSRRK